MPALTEPLLVSKPTGKRSYKSVKLLEEIVFKANIIAQVDGGTAADFLSDLVLRYPDLERHYSEAVKKIQARKKGGRTSDEA